MSEPWLTASIAARMVRLRSLVAQDNVKAIAKHLSDLADYARIGGLAQLDEAVRHAGDLGSTGRPIAMVIDAIGRASLEEGAPPAVDVVPVQALLVNLAALGRAEGATVDVVAVPLLVPGALAKRFAIALAAMLGDALDHAPRPVKASVAMRHENDQLIAEVASGGAKATFSHPFRP